MTARRDVRRRGTLALLAGSLLSIVMLLLTTGASTATGQACEPLVTPGCDTTTIPDPTSSSSDTTATTVEATTSSTALETTTTRRPSSTTERQPIATAATPTTIAVSTSQNVLVPGDGTEGAESTTTTTVQTATTISSQDGHDRMLISLVIAGLLLLAVAVAVLTWRYWAATRPPLVAG